MILGLAPMDGFTDLAMRDITQNIFDKYNQNPDFELRLWTEFMTADGYIHNPQGVIRHLFTDSSQTHLIAQIFGGNIDTLSKTAASIDSKYGKYFRGIELNLGCPANNIMKSGGGAELIKDKEKSLAIIKNIKKFISLPFSIKTRTGTDEKDKKNQFEFLLQASQYVDMVTIHARTTKEGYGPNLDWEFIYTLKERLPNQIIVGNGGISNYNQIATMKKNLDGIMIGQGAIGNPRIFTPHIPDKKEIKETIIKHLDLMVVNEMQFQKIILEKNFDILCDKQYKKNLHLPALGNLICQFRKHLFNYVKGLAGSKEFKIKVSQIKDYDGLRREIDNFFK